MKTKLESSREGFSKALVRFQEILQEKKTDIVRDSAIKRFEMAFDLAWKTVKAFLEEYHNTACVSPRTCFREAFRLGLIDYDEYWIRICQLRNDTVHTYNEALAEKIYGELPKVHLAFQKLAVAIDTASKG